MNLNSQKPVILVVDDVATNIDVIKSILSKDYFIQAALNGKTALKIINRNKPDLVLLDIIMPEMSGYEVCRQVKANPETASIPLVFFTTRDEENDEILGFDLGAVDYITKPVNATILRARVKVHILQKPIKTEQKQTIAEQKVGDSLIMHKEHGYGKTTDILKDHVKQAKTDRRGNTISTEELNVELDTIAQFILNYDPEAEKAVAKLLERVENHQFCTTLVLLYKYLTDYNYDAAATHLAKFIRTQKTGVA